MMVVHDLRVPLAIHHALRVSFRLACWRKTRLSSWPMYFDKGAAAGHGLVGSFSAVPVGDQIPSVQFGARRGYDVVRTDWFRVVGRKKLRKGLDQHLRQAFRWRECPRRSDTAFPSWAWRSGLVNAFGQSQAASDALYLSSVWIGGRRNNRHELRAVPRCDRFRSFMRSDSLSSFFQYAASCL